MSYIKTQEEIKQLKQGGQILGEILEKLANMVEPGISAWKIDKQAEKLIKKVGGRPAFKGYASRKGDIPFPSTICASINHDLVHGIATKEKILKEGDIFSIDIGMEYPRGKGEGGRGKGYFTDTSITVTVGKILEETQKLLNATRKALEIGIEQCVVGNTVADIGRAIQDFVEPQGYGIVRDLVGHGVGHAVHEEPRVPNFYDKDLEKYKLEPGVVLAIEPMITIGDYAIETAEDGWSISTKDKSLCAHFEHTVIILEDGSIVVTRRPSEKI